MKAIMYHYVRDYDPDFPFFRYLDVKNFEKQLDFFEENFGFVSQEEWLDVIGRKSLGSAAGKVILTFDDAMSCHYEYVSKVLKERKLWGIFYVPTQPYQKNNILDVHEIHLLCGAIEGRKLWNTLKFFLRDEMMPDVKRKEFREATYARQSNYEGVSEFKRVLNYFVDYKYRRGLIDAVKNELHCDFSSLDFYVSVDKLREMQANGNLIGSHTISHPVMSKLSPKHQNEEIEGSFQFLRSKVGGEIMTYCHPYGGHHSFDEATILSLEKMGVSFSFSVEQRDICDQDLLNSIHFLPRYDCNQFPHGGAS